MRILITGGAGFIGSYLATTMQSKYDVVTVDTKAFPRRDNHIVCDLTDSRTTQNLLNDTNPDVIIHCAAMKNLLRCDRNRARAFETNVNMTRKLAEYASRNDIFMVYLSSDQVFDGRKGFYIEDDEVHPLNIYGQTKLEGEHAVIHITRNAAICRTAMVYGQFPPHLRDHVNRETSRDTFEGADQSLFPQWIVAKLEKGETTRVYSDRFCTPTYIGDLGNMIHSVIADQKRGLFHTAGPERVNRYEYAKMIAEVWDLNTSLLEPVTYTELVERPADCSLSIEKARRELSANPTPLKEGLEKLKLEYNETYKLFNQHTTNGWVV